MKFSDNQLNSDQKRANADKVAKASLYMGTIAVLLLLVPATTLFFALPFGILAILYEKKALKNGTSKVNLSAYGKTLGTIALCCLALELILALALMIGWYFQN